MPKNTDDKLTPKNADDKAAPTLDPLKDPIKNTDGSAILIPLKHPFTNAAGEHISSLKMRRAKRKDMVYAAKYAKDEVDQETALFARLTVLTMEDVDNLDVADAKALSDSFRGMLDQ